MDFTFSYRKFYFIFGTISIFTTMNMDVFASRFIFLGACFVSVLALGQLLIKKKTNRNWAYFGLYFCLSIFQFANANVDELQTFRYPHLSLVDLPFLYIVGPVLWFLASPSKQNEKPLKSFFIYWGPAILVCIILFPYYLKGAEEKRNLLVQAYSTGKYSLPEFMYGFSVFVLLMYLGWITLSLRKIWTIHLIRSEPAVLQTTIMLILAITAATLTFLGIILFTPSLVRAGVFCISVTIILAFLAGHRYPKFMQTYLVLAKQAQYSKAKLKKNESERIGLRLSKVMNEEKIFLDEQLTLGDLAAAIDASSHDLSQYLNSVEEKNFSTYVNLYRIEEAKSKILEGRSTILNIAYEVGFNSKASFNRAFKKHMQMTPQEFRKKSSG